METLKAIFLLLLAGGTAFLFNYLHWRIQEKKKSILSTASTLNEYLDNLELEALNYWSKNFEDKGNPETQKKILEIRIKSLLKVSRRVINELAAKDLQSILPSENLKLNNFSSQIFDLVTGEPFEDDDYDKDFTKCAKISNKINEVKVIILKIMNSNR